MVTSDGEVYSRAGGARQDARGCRWEDDEELVTMDGSSTIDEEGEG